MLHSFVALAQFRRYIPKPVNDVMSRKFRFFLEKNLVPVRITLHADLTYSAIHPVCHNVLLRFLLKVVRSCLGSR